MVDGLSVLCDNAVVYFLLKYIFIFGINRKIKIHVKYPNVLSTIKPVPHGPSIPVPEVTGGISEMECSSSTESKASEKDSLNAEPSTKPTEALNTA